MWVSVAAVSGPIGGRANQRLLLLLLCAAAGKA